MKTSNSIDEKCFLTNWNNQIEHSNLRWTENATVLQGMNMYKNQQFQTIGSPANRIQTVGSHGNIFSKFSVALAGHGMLSGHGMQFQLLQVKVHSLNITEKTKKDLQKTFVYFKNQIKTQIWKM